MCSTPRRGATSRAVRAPLRGRRGGMAHERGPTCTRRASWRPRSSPGNSATRPGSRPRRWASAVPAFVPGGRRAAEPSTSPDRAARRGARRASSPAIPRLRVQLLGSLRSSSTCRGSSSGDDDSPTSRSRWPAGSTSPPRSCRHSCTLGASPAGSSQTLHERLAVSNEALELARALDQRELVMQALTFRLVDLLELGDVRRPTPTQRCSRLAARAPRALLPVGHDLVRRLRAILEGRFADAESLAAQAYQHGPHAHGLMRRGDVPVCALPC